MSNKGIYLKCIMRKSQYIIDLKCVESWSAVKHSFILTGTPIIGIFVCAGSAVKHSSKQREAV